MSAFPLSRPKAHIFWSTSLEVADGHKGIRVRAALPKLPARLAAIAGSDLRGKERKCNPDGARKRDEKFFHANRLAIFLPLPRKTSKPFRLGQKGFATNHARGAVAY